MSNPKNSPFDNLQNEIAKEKFSALRRITENLSGCLRELEAMSVRIDKAIQDNLAPQEINKRIEAFNSLREDAEEWRYYLIATREASGLFHSNLKADIYRIPPRRKPVTKSVHK
ncbi:MAG: hypothetical protein LLG40_14175 [Deltaproteobacteria bacterium]|nr:hypothetical protein [Deltaproteobacteria bacterium]